MTALWLASFCSRAKRSGCRANSAAQVSEQKK
jgi:hypothetical protein